MRDLVSVSLAFANFQFSLVAAAGNCILCALFDAAAVIRRQLSTILLETLALSLSLSLRHNQLVCAVSLALPALLLLVANHKNGQRAPFWVAFKVLFHFIAIYFSWFCFITLLDICCYCFCCVLFAKYAHTHSRIGKRNLLCIFSGFHLPFRWLQIVSFCRVSRSFWQCMLRPALDIVGGLISVGVFACPPEPSLA